MNQLPLKAYIKPPDPKRPCFVTPIFGDPQGKSYVQVMHDREAVKDFEALGLGDYGLHPTDSSVSAIIGGEAVFAFFFSENDVIFGRRSSFSEVLRKRLSELQEYPFTRLSVASFVGDDRQIRESVKSAFAELSTRNRVVALDWRRSAALTYPFPENPNFAVNWCELNEFTLQLLKFVRSYRCFLHTANSGTRRFALTRYESSFKNVLAFFFDSDFLAALREQLERLDQSTAQYSMSFESDYDSEQVGALTRLGLSNRAAQRFLAQVESRRGSIKGKGAVNPQDALMSVLNADTVVRQRISLVRELTRAEKKVQKRELTIGTISIAYGLVLLLRSYSEDTHATGSDFHRLAIDAIRAGVKNLAPSSKVRDAGHEIDNLFKSPS